MKTVVFIFSEDAMKRDIERIVDCAKDEGKNLIKHVQVGLEIPSEPVTVMPKMH